MAHARVQALLYPAGQHLVGQQQLRGALQVGHVDPAALALERGELGQQRARQPRQPLLMLPGGVLGVGGEDVRQRVLRGTHAVDAGHLVAELARRIFLREQGGAHAHRIARVERHTQFVALLLEGGRGGLRQARRGLGQQAGSRRVVKQRIARRVETGEFGKQRPKRRHRAIHHPAASASSNSARFCSADCSALSVWWRPCAVTSAW